MNACASLSRRPRRRFWGWGLADAALDPRERTIVEAMLASVGTHFEDRPAPRVEEFVLSPPRVVPPATLAACFSASPLDRLNHSAGKSYADCARMWMRRPPSAPDWVAFPDDEQAVVDILDWAQARNVAVIPYGGGSSVCGGVEAAVGSGFSGTVSIDLERLNRVVEVDPISRAARIQAGALGPELATQLRAHRLTLRHFPQSFEFSSLGGWIATRAGGHYATLYTHIDDFVEATRLVTPAGVMQTRRLPGSGAGPAPDRLVIGSEGTLGVVTEAWVRVQVPPRFRASASAQFDDYFAAVACVRALAQSGLNPSNCRLLDPAETIFAGVGDGRTAMLVLAFESDDHPLQAWMARALEIVSTHGGRYDAEAVARSMSSEDSVEHRTGASGAWRDAFMRMPYWRDPAVGLGVIMDTFETAITWDQWPEFDATVRDRVGRVLRDTFGEHHTLSCRFTHVYTDGPAPYYTWSGMGRQGSEIEQWQIIKDAANETLVAAGGTATHHHAVGRMHRPNAYDLQRPDLFADAIRAVKKTLDPNGILNPGVLIDP